MKDAHRYLRSPPQDLPLVQWMHGRRISVAHDNTRRMSKYRYRPASQIDREATTQTNLFRVMVHGPTRENRRGRHPDSTSRLSS